MTTIRKIQMRRDTAANWTAANPVLLSGEKGLESDTRREKTGDGVTAWSLLAYSRLNVGTSSGTVAAGDDSRLASYFAPPGANGLNVFLGSGAGNSALTGSTGDQGSYLTYVGAGAGALTTTGGSNTYLGTNAGRSTTSGSYNTFGGHSSGYYVNVGTFNTAFGYQAGDGLRANHYNTLLGANAGYGLISGDYNVMVGDSTGMAANGAQANTIVGSSAAYNITTGEANVVVGASAGYDITTGGDNILIGHTAGMGISTGSGNVIIGAVTGLTSSLSNTIIIADGAGNQRIVVNSSGNTTVGSVLNIGSTDCRLFRDSGNLYVESDGLIYFRDTSSSADLFAIANDGRTFFKKTVWHSDNEGNARFRFLTGATEFSGVLQIGDSDCRIFRDSGNLFIESDGLINIRDTSTGVTYFAFSSDGRTFTQVGVAHADADGLARYRYNSAGSHELLTALQIATRTIATLPSAASSAGQRFQVSDSATIANRMVFSNGTAWYYEGTAVAV